MKIGEGVEALSIAMDFLGTAGTIHPVVLWNDSEGATIIDTGMLGNISLLQQALLDIGVRFGDIRRILLTHQDIDHIGCAAAIVAATHAEVYAHAADAPFIRGEAPLLKLDPKRLEARLRAMPEDRQRHARALIASPPRAPVDHELNGGEELPFHGGITVIPTPGHTPGHVCFYIKTLRLLVAGDALRVENGSLIGPSPVASYDVRRAVTSLKNLLPYAIDAILCYHGGLADHDVDVRLRQLTRIAT